MAGLLRRYVIEDGAELVSDQDNRVVAVLIPGMRRYRNPEDLGFPPFYVEGSSHRARENDPANFSPTPLVGDYIVLGNKAGISNTGTAKIASIDLDFQLPTMD